MTAESDHCFGQSVTADQVILFGDAARTAAVEYDDCNPKGLPEPEIGVRMATDQASGQGCYGVRL
jgi:hypothetical protein